MADEPSIPMDQEEEEDNDEYYSAREVQKKGSQESVKSTTPSQLTSSPNITDSSPRQQLFFSDEKAQQGSSAESMQTKKSEKARRKLKDKSIWDMREYKKEELEAKPKLKKKKKKSKTPKKKAVAIAVKKEKEEKSKTDEESEEEAEPSPKESERVRAPAKTSKPRPFFLSEAFILKCKSEKPIAPRTTFNVLRFEKTQEVVEYDEGGNQHQLPACSERAISNPWRRWGSHRTLCDQGGFMVGKNKKLIEIKRGSDPPPCPPNPRQVTLNKNSEAPDSQTMMGTLKVETRPSEEEAPRIARVMEEYVRNGGFVPPPMTKKEMAAKPARAQTPKAAKTPKKKKSNTGSQSESRSEEGGTEDDAEKGKPVKDDSKKGAFGFLKKKKSGTNLKPSAHRRNK